MSKHTHLSISAHEIESILRLVDSNPVPIQRDWLKSKQDMLEQTNKNMTALLEAAKNARHAFDCGSERCNTCHTAELKLEAAIKAAEGEE